MCRKVATGCEFGKLCVLSADTETSIAKWNDQSS
jgi:hypothetical protein